MSVFLTTNPPLTPAAPQSPVVAIPLSPFAGDPYAVETMSDGTFDQSPVVTFADNFADDVVTTIPLPQADPGDPDNGVNTYSLDLRAGPAPGGARAGSGLWSGAMGMAIGLAGLSAPAILAAISAGLDVSRLWLLPAISMLLVFKPVLGLLNGEEPTPVDPYAPTRFLEPSQADDGVITQATATTGDMPAQKTSNAAGQTKAQQQPPPLPSQSADGRSATTGERLPFLRLNDVPSTDGDPSGPFVPQTDAAMPQLETSKQPQPPDSSPKLGTGAATGMSTAPTMGGRTKNTWPPLTGFKKDPSPFDEASIPGYSEETPLKTFNGDPLNYIGGGNVGTFDSLLYKGTGRVVGLTTTASAIPVGDRDAIGFAIDKNYVFIDAAGGYPNTPNGARIANMLTYYMLKQMVRDPNVDFVKDIGTIGARLGRTDLPANAATTFAGAKLLRTDTGFDAQIITIGDTGAVVVRPGKGVIFFTTPNSHHYSEDSFSRSEMRAAFMSYLTPQPKNLAAMIRPGVNIFPAEVLVSDIALQHGDTVIVYTNTIGQNLTPTMIADFFLTPSYSLGDAGRAFARAAVDASNADNVTITMGNNTASISATKGNVSFVAFKVVTKTN